MLAERQTSSFAMPLAQASAFDMVEIPSWHLLSMLMGHFWQILSPECLFTNHCICSLAFGTGQQLDSLNLTTVNHLYLIHYVLLHAYVTCFWSSVLV